MKKTILLLTLSLFTVFTACKKEPKKGDAKSTEQVAVYTLDAASAKIGWTAYKTTDKIAVKGEFKELNLKVGKNSSEPIALLNSTKFSIPISSLFSNNEDRDSKLKQFFFGVMKNTNLLTGKINLEKDGNGTLTILMNGVENSLPITYTLENQQFSFSGTMNLDEWNGNEAILSINKACLDLHKAADGISKTWNDVQIDAMINLVKN